MNAKKTVDVVEVVRHNGPIMLPDDLAIDKAIEALQRKAEYEKKEISFNETIDVFPWDGAIAMKQALEEIFGMALQREHEIETFFGPMKQKPRIMQIEVGPGKTISIPWGAFSLPGITGLVATEFGRDADGRVIFQMLAKVLHRDEDKVRRLFARVREIAESKSIYDGSAISIRFRDDEDDLMGLPKIQFLRLGGPQPIFSKDLERAIETAILTPIRFAESARKAGIPLKRGALLAGRYGTGKTLTADQIARTAIENRWTFVYVQNVSELAEALRFARRYQPAVVFAEDVDRAAGVNRDQDVNEILNVLDGIGGKQDEIMVILTTNHPESINPAMRRPGRIDIVLEVRPPDAEAAMRLIRQYGRNMVPEHEDLRAAGAALSGHIPAVIREVVERSKLEAIRRSDGDASVILGEDIVNAAKTLIAEQELFTPATPDKRSDREKAAHILAEGLKKTGSYQPVG